MGKWLPWASDFSENSYREFVKFALHQYADDKAIHTHIIYDDKIIGAVSLNNIYHHLKKAEIGYWLRQDYQGRGIMTFAVRAIMDIAKHTMACTWWILKQASIIPQADKSLSDWGSSFVVSSPIMETSMAILLTMRFICIGFDFKY